MTNLVEIALQGMPPTRRAPAAAIHHVVPVRPPRTRSLVSTLLQGDALKADVKRFFRTRHGSLPVAWDMDMAVEVERSLGREPGYREGGFIGLLRFACDLHESAQVQSSWTENRLWSLIRRRLSSSSGLMLLRSVANAHEILQSLLDDVEGPRRRGFCDLLRVLGARTGQILLEHPRLIDRPIWEFSLLLTVRADQYNSEFRNVSGRAVRPLDLLLGSISVYLRERGLEPALADLRTSVLQTGAPLGPALDAWIRTLRQTPGSSLIPGLEIPDDPRNWIWQTGESLLEQEGLIDRMGRLASCERALLDRARGHESWKDDVALSIESELRKEIERVLPESRRMPSSMLKTDGGDTFHAPEPERKPDPRASSDLDLQTAMLSFTNGSWAVLSETSEGIPTIGFGLADLERQARWVGDGWKAGWTPTGHVWVEKYRTLLGDPRVREFLRLGPTWIAGLRDLLTDADPILMAGLEDMIRWIYPAKFRPEQVEFRQNQRPGVPVHRTGYDWTVLRLMALTLAEVASAAREPGLAPSCLVVLHHWQQLSRFRDIAPSSPEWWAWLADEVDQRAEAEGERRFPELVAIDDDWKMRHVAPWIAFPSPVSASILGEWVKNPLEAMKADAHLVHERWASRLSMLTQMQDEAKEEALLELLPRIYGQPSSF
ncbi:MAG: hypothetical protein RL173_1409 [Fibrobacterota bacterium]